MKKYITISLLLSSLLLYGCSANIEDEFDGSIQQGDTNQQELLDALQEVESLVFPYDDYTETLSESVSFLDNEEINITESGTYEFNGEYIYSTITVNVDKELDSGTVYILLNDVSIISEDNTPINVIEAENVVIVLSGENTITQGNITTTDENFPSAAIYSKADTVITGEGNLTVTTLFQDGINSRDDLIIDGVTINVNAQEDGIVGKDFLAINDSHITIDAKKDGLKSSNSEALYKGNLLIVSGTFDINSGNDAISSENILQIEDGNFILTTGNGYVEVIKTPSSGPVNGNLAEGRENFNMNQQGNINKDEFPPNMIPSEFNENENIQEETDDLIESMKALKALNHITINGGVFNISAYEDAVHCDGSIIINDGEYTINTGDDGFTSINTIITNGIITIENCFEGIEGELVNISGGEIYINTNDDGINANTQEGGVTISGGYIEIIFGVGGDGIDSNGSYTQTGGNIVITASQASDVRNAPLDVDGMVVMSGGTIVDENGTTIEATSSGHMAEMAPSGERDNPHGFNRNANPQ